eukprot:11416440-Ditylum_brightwellii.AAC.1
MVKVTVLRCKCTADDILWGTANTNAILDTRVYKCKFPTVVMEYFGANVIAKTVYADVDDEGHFYSILDGILNHQKNEEAISKEDGWFVL